MGSCIKRTCTFNLYPPIVLLELSFITTMHCYYKKLFKLVTLKLPYWGPSIWKAFESTPGNSATCCWSRRPSLEAWELSPTCHLRTISPSSLKIRNISHCFSKSTIRVFLITPVFLYLGKLNNTCQEVNKGFGMLTILQ